MPDVLWGDLDRVGLASILQLLELEGHHGRVVVEGGHLLLIDGQVVGGAYLALDGIDAAVEALVRARGGFVVTDGTEEASGRGVGVQHVVLESCRILDDLERFGAMAPAAGLSAEGPLGRVLAAADGERTLADLIVGTEQTVVHVLPAYVQALEAGAVRGTYTSRADDLERLEVRGAPPSAPAAASAPAGPVDDPSDFDDLVFDARKLVRQRRFDEAVSTLERALRLRPDSRIVQQNLSRVLELQARG